MFVTDNYAKMAILIILYY